MFRLLISTYSVLLLALAGCGSGANPADGPNSPPPAQGLLSPVDSGGLEASLKTGLTQLAQPQLEQFISTDALAAAPGTGNFTGTYTTDLNVDEMDTVRYDGKNLYIAPTRFAHCCFILESAAAPATAPPEPERSIRILATDPTNTSAQLAGEIQLDDDTSVQGMYIDGDRLVALTSTSTFGTYGGLWTDIAIWAPEQLGLQIYGVGDPSNPILRFDAEIDGVFVDSRRIGNTLYIVSRYTPWIDGLHYHVADATQAAQNEALLANASLTDLLPKVTVAGESRQLVAPDNCYVTTDDDAGYPVITSVTAIPIDDPDNFKTTCYNEEAYGVYVSENALYFTEYRPDVAQARDVTRIHKFSLAATDIQYRGSADIRGTVWRGGQADFRMNESSGDLRLIASEWDWSSDDFVDHNLYVLREVSTELALDIVSTLPNAERPDEIGKPNEALYGVRFLGNVAYAVTFEQIDPLYAIDLSDPADPFIAGELEVTGFSDFLHPVSDDLLLGLGQSANGGIKLELFDVADISQPLSRGSLTLGGRGSYSEALYDRHAFTYQADMNGVDRFTIPAQIYASDGSWDFLGSALHLFEIRDKATPALSTLVDAGAIAPPSVDPNSPDWVERSRAFIHDDTVYYIRDESVWGANWFAPSSVSGPF